MFRYLVSIISLLFIITSPCMGDIASSGYVNRVRDNVQAKIDNKADNANYTQNMVLQTDNSGNVIATTVGTDLLADGSIQTMHLADGAVTNADLAGMIDITKLNLGTLPTSGKHIMIWNAETNEYVFEKLNNGLPDGYTRLEYIESTGTQWIDTGIRNNDNNMIYIDYDSTIITTLYGCSESGWATNSAISYLGDIRFLLSDKMYNLSNTGKHNVFTGNILYGIDIDGAKHAWEADSGNSSLGTITLFKGYVRNDVSYGSYRLYMFRIFDTNSILVRNLIPAKRNSDGVIGMYDTVTETFFTNAGTGNFIAGPEI